MRVPRWATHPTVFNYGLSLFAFVAGLVLTIWAWQLAAENQTAAQRAQFRRISQQAVDTLQDRFASYATLVRSGQALFVSSEQVDARQWRIFVRELGLHKNYPAVVAFDYVRRVPQRRLEDFERRIRKTRPDFKLSGLGHQSIHCILEYEAPPRPNSPGAGGDACAWPKFNTVIRQLDSSGGIAVSGPVTLDTRPLRNPAGMLMVAPVHLPRNAVGEPPAGWVTAVLSVDRLLHDAIPPGSDVAVNVNDNGALLWSSGNPERAGVCKQSILTTRCLGFAVPLDLPGRSWTLLFYQPGALAVNAWEVAAAGTCISLLLGIMLLRSGRIQHRAQALATEMTSALRESENLLSSVTNNIFEGIYRSKPGENIIYMNKSMATMFGYASSEEMRAAPAANLYADPKRRDELGDLLEQDGFYHGEEVEFVRRDGSHFIGVNNAVAVYDETGNIAYYDGAISDITSRKAVEERLWYLARYDSLTGLANRATFREMVRQEINRAGRAGGRLAILFLDLDRFKTVNDYLGHNAGDKLLKAVSQRIQGCLGRDDIASRQGGDEFLILLTDVDGSDQVARFAEDMLQTVAGGYTIGAHDITVTPSIGISLYPDHGGTVEALIRDADAAMYHAKARGRFNVQLFTPELDANRQTRIEIESDLRMALNDDQFALHYQPQIELATGRIIGAEALLRWQHPDKGMIGPAEFIPVAEQSGLIVPIGEWVLREACRQNREWQLTGLPIVPVAVNISAVQFLRRTLDQTILDALAETGLAPRYLELELTETMLMQDIKHTVDVLEKLRRTGIQFAIDDFGTGYSSLSYLRWFKINKLKIDQSFVRDVATNPDDAVIIDAIVGLARSFRVRVLAEGVETAEQLACMRERACDDIQGYYFSRPIPAAEFAVLLQAGSLGPAEEQAAAAK
ncbi:MAG TPA: EAL domain-containing protein [Gammaproteobacteria bacterium]|nr:EAL domain-containing protein [Gammaproteobacteria bacterium]